MKRIIQGDNNNLFAQKEFRGPIIMNKRMKINMTSQMRFFQKMEGFKHLRSGQVKHRFYQEMRLTHRIGL